MAENAKPASRSAHIERPWLFWALVVFSFGSTMWMIVTLAASLLRQA